MNNFKLLSEIRNILDNIQSVSEITSNGKFIYFRYGLYYMCISLASFNCISISIKGIYAFNHSKQLHIAQKTCNEVNVKFPLVLAIITKNKEIDFESNFYYNNENGRSTLIESIAQLESAQQFYLDSFIMFTNPNYFDL